MGSGEFDGGSSVTWSVENSDGEFGSGNKGGAHGKDRFPKGPNGRFVVTITGRAPIIVPSKGTKVRVIWGDEEDALVTTQASRATGARTTKARKSKASK